VRCCFQLLILCGEAGALAGSCAAGRGGCSDGFDAVKTANQRWRGEWFPPRNQYNSPHKLSGRALDCDPPDPALQLSVLSAVPLQLYHLVFDLELFLLQPVDLEVVGARSRHFFLDLQFQ
jgi:hypothetical protein